MSNALADINTYIYNYDKFEPSDELTDTISKIISQKEETNYICKKIIITIQNHKELVFESPTDNYKPYGGGLNSLSGAQINAINKKHGKYVEKNTPEEKISYLVIMNSETFQDFSNIQFKNKNDIDKILDILCTFHMRFFNEERFKGKKITEKYPYLQNFFDSLNEMRDNVGSIPTLNKEILANCEKINNKSFQKTYKKNN